MTDELITLYKTIDGTVRTATETRRSYELVWKKQGWRLSPPKAKKEKK
jgi:hypothetical protein